jgi:hypothetical protein
MTRCGALPPSSYNEHAVYVRGAETYQKLYARNLYKWALTTLSSRSFTSSILPQSMGDATKQHLSKDTSVFPVLIPLIDMMNHKPLHKVEWRTGENEIGFAVMKTLMPGEVWNNYGPKSNEHRAYGILTFLSRR